MKNKALVLSLINILWCFNLFAQNDFYSLLTQRLNDYLIENIQEKIYIQTNSNEYAPGDTIWFKASLVNAITHSPMRAEKVVYVDLISPDKAVVYHHAFRVFSGFSAGYFPVGASISYGSYQLVAYTNYMKNYSSDFFFKKEINILRSSNQLVSWKFQPEISTATLGDSLTLNLRVNKENGTEVNDMATVFVEIGDQVFKRGTAKITENFGVFQLFIPDSLLKFDANITVSLPYDENSTGRYKLTMPGAKPDLQFLPESGWLIPNVPNTLAFKCIDAAGKPVNLAGEIYNSNNKLVSRFATEYSGMGTCSITPEADEVLIAEIEWNNQKLRYPLPVVRNNAYGLHLLKDTADSLYFSIHKPTTRLEKLTILGHTRGIIHFFSAGGIENKETVLAIPKHQFLSGIAVFTLMVKNFPQAERLVYIDRDDQLQLSIDSNKKEYGKREKVELKILATDKVGNPVKGSFTLNAFDIRQEQSLSPFENIQNYLLCSSDLHGTVLETLNCFDSENPNAALNLDLLMLTNGWRRFAWNDVYSNIKLEKKYQMESGLKLEGEVRRAINNKPVPKNIEVSITMSRRLPVFHSETLTDEFGRFSFDLPEFSDSANFIIQTKNRLNKNNDFVIEIFTNTEHKQLDHYSFNKVSSYNPDPIVKTIDNKGGSSEVLIHKPVVREKRFDNYYFPGKDTFLIEEVQVHSNFLSQRDSLIHKTGEPDVVIEAEQVKKLVENRDWYSSIWDLLRDQIPGLLIMQRPYDSILAKKCNLVIKGDPECIYFDVPENSDGILHIIVDGQFLGRGSVKLYDFLSYMDPAEIESVNFIARPKKYEAPGFDDLIDLDFDVAQDVDAYENYDLMFQQGVGAINATNEYMDTLTKLMSPPSYLYITTKSKEGVFYQKPPGIANLYLKGYSNYKEFYSPRYPNFNTQKQMVADYRKTLLWEPNVITDSTGRAVVEFFTSDADGPISIILQGLSVDGRTGVVNYTLNENLTKTPVPNVPQLSNHTFIDETNYTALGLLKGKVVDDKSKIPLTGASLTQTNPYYHVSCNNEGEFIIDQKKIKYDNLIVVSCPGYLSKNVTSSVIENQITSIELEKAMVQTAEAQKSAVDIVRSSIRKSWGYYDSDKVFQGYYRETVAVNHNYYGIYESGFNYSNKLRAGLARALLFETDKAKSMEDKNGHKLLILKPNHRSIYYPLKNDILSFSPAFWDFSQLRNFNFELLGEVMYDGSLCYKISFDINENVILPLEKGLLYIDKESFALRSAKWQTSPKNVGYLSYTRFLQTNPLDYQLAVRSSNNQVNYAFIDGHLILQTAKSQIEILVNNTDILKFENELSVFGVSYKQAKYLENSTFDLLVEKGETSHYLIQKAQYQIKPWIGFGIIKPESYLIRDAVFLHDITMFR